MKTLDPVHDSFDAVWPYADPEKYEISEKYTTNDVPLGSFSDFVIHQYQYTGVRFSDNNGDIRFQFEPLSILTFGSIVTAISQFTTTFFTTGFATSAAYVMPKAFFHFSGNYHFEDYPFASETGFLTRYQNKRHAQNIFQLSPNTDQLGMSLSGLIVILSINWV